MRMIYGLFAWLLRQTGGLFRYWMLFLGLAFFVSPIGPHMRWEYTYKDIYGRKAFVSCTYMGSRGLITPLATDQCPFFIWVDSRDVRR